MRQLLLLRHAKSSWDDPRLSDHARPLNARGRRAAMGMGLAMRELGLAPDIVLVSSARRTLQTLEAISDAFNVPESLNNLSKSVVLPWSTCAIIAMLRIFLISVAMKSVYLN